MERPDTWTYQFLDDGEGEPVRLTNAEFDRRVRAVAATLAERVPAGERALVVCPPGLDYVTSFFACLYAGVIAVPVYPPDRALRKSTLPRLLGVIEDARPAAVLAPVSLASMVEQMTRQAPALKALAWETVDDVDPAVAESWNRPDIGGDDVAFLQYTSGSTSQPKGVMVSHANLLDNMRILNPLLFGNAPDAHMVTWLPPYHDMGLIGGLLSPAYAGVRATFMPPVSFLKRPVRWLRAISAHRGTVGGAPNFAYDLCVTKTSEEDRQGLDLSNWRVAFSAAEPVRPETIDRFTRTFAPRGFRRRAFYPCYGLAEATLCVSAGDPTAEPVARRLQAEALAGGSAVVARPGENARTLVGCGQATAGHEVLIVDPEALTRLPEHRVGEIWVSGASVAQGYWRMPKESEAVFSARLPDTGEGPFLRTGDLGFLDGAELYVTGRLKDVIIVDGKNHYPQDIERSVEACDPALRPGCGVACSHEVDGKEQLIIVHEVSDGTQTLDTDHVISSIYTTVAREHGLPVHDVVLVRRGSVPKTSSGKLQRRACLEAFLEDDLDCLAAWSLPKERTERANPIMAARRVDSPAPKQNAAPAPAHLVRGRPEIEERLSRELAKRLDLPAETLDPSYPLANYGLQSSDLVELIGDLEQWLGRKLSATVVWDYPTIEELAAFLSDASGR